MFSDHIGMKIDLVTKKKKTTGKTTNIWKLNVTEQYWLIE